MRCLSRKTSAGIEHEPLFFVTDGTTSTTVGDEEMGQDEEMGHVEYGVYAIGEPRFLIHSACLCMAFIPTPRVRKFP